ncbi:MAG: lytic transglycosylase domain-containing protein [archaeon]
MLNFSREKSLEEKVEKVDLSRRNLLINGGLLGLGVLLFGGKALSAQEKPVSQNTQTLSYDISYGTFYNFDNAINRFWDLKTVFTEQNLHIIRLDDKLGERYRVITYGGHDLILAGNVAEAKKSQLISFFEKQKPSMEELARKVGDVAPLSRVKDADDRTPEKAVEKKDIVVQKEEPSKYYINFSSNLDKEHADLDRRLLNKFGFKDAIVAEEEVNGKKFFKTQIGGYASQDYAATIAERVLKHRELVDLLGFPEINVVKAKYENGIMTTDWSDSILIRHEVKAEKIKAKIKEKGKRRVVTQGLKCPEEIDNLIDKAVSEWNVNHSSTGYRIDPDLIKAMVWKESNYNPNKPGYKLEHKGKNKFKYTRDANGERILTAYGLMQVTRGAAEEMGFVFENVKSKDRTNETVKDDSLTNLRCGVAYFGKYFVRNKGDLKDSLGAYNAGPSRVKNDAYMKYAETRMYIAGITEQYNALKIGSKS